MKEETYLGDGLYASFDGYYVKLHTHNGYQETNAVFLEPEVVSAFLNFVKASADAARAKKTASISKCPPAQ